MTTRTYNQNTLYHGQWNVICDVCGHKFKSDDIKERWDGMRVCREDWETRHPMDFQRGFADDQSVPYTRPDQTNASGTDDNGNPVEGTDVSGNTVPAALNITTTSLGALTKGTVVSLQLETDIVPSPTAVWSLVSGTLPTGLSLNTANGMVTGTATASGSFTPLIKVLDGVGRSDTQLYNTTVGAGEPLSWRHVSISLGDDVDWRNVDVGLVNRYNGGALDDGTIYLLGSTGAYTLDTTTFTWTARTAESTGVIFTGGGEIGCVLSDGSGYLVVGNNVTTSATWDRATDSWTSRGPAPRSVAPQWQHGEAASYNGYVYIFGGYEGSGSTSTIQVYNELTGAWSLSAATTPIAMRHGVAVTLPDGRILVGGGTTVRYWFFDPTDNSFTETTSIDTADNRKRANCAVVLSDGRVYIGGGQDATNTDQDDTYIFDPSAETWTDGAALLPIVTSDAGTAGEKVIIGPDGNLYLFRGDGLNSSEPVYPWVSGDTL